MRNDARNTYARPARIVAPINDDTVCRCDPHALHFPVSRHPDQDKPRFNRIKTIGQAPFSIVPLRRGDCLPLAAARAGRQRAARVPRSRLPFGPQRISNNLLKDWLSSELAEAAGRADVLIRCIEIIHMFDFATVQKNGRTRAPLGEGKPEFARDVRKAQVSELLWEVGRSR